MPEHGPPGNPHNSQFTAETGIPTDRFGFKTNKLGRGIDDFLASLIGGPQSPQGPDNPEADPVGPISPPIGLPPQPMRGIQAEAVDPSRADPGGTVGQQVEPVAGPLEAFGGFGPGGGVPFDQSRTTFPPGGQPATPAITAPPTPPIPSTSPGLNDLLIGPGDALSGVMGLRPEGERLQTPGNMSIVKQLMLALGLTAAPLAAPALANPLTTAAAGGQALRSAGQSAIGGARQLPAMARTLANRMGVPKGQAQRAAGKATGKKVRATSKGKATKAKTRREAANRREAKRQREAVNTKVGGG